MVNGTLVKITPAKKLMVRIDKQTYDNLTQRMQLLARKLGHTDSRLATWSYENDFGDEQFCISIKLDKYDIQNLRKFEALVRSEIVFNGSFKPYAFIPEGETEQKYGINYELVSIRKKQQNACVLRDEIDEMVESRFAQQPLTEEEREIDAVVEKQALSAIEAQMAALENDLSVAQ